jgi:hypothetical protein
VTVRSALDKVFKFRATQYVIPTITAVYVNRFLVKELQPPLDLPNKQWANHERHALLDRSEERLRSLEGKGPGLATVTAIIAAGVIVSIQSGWTGSDGLGRLLLVIAAVYAGFSLVTPIYLVGPQVRSQIWGSDLEEAVNETSPEEWLAQKAADAAVANSKRTIRLANLQTGARNELAVGFVALALWAILVPATGALKHHQRASPHRTQVSARSHRREFHPEHQLT